MELKITRTETVDVRIELPIFIKVIETYMTKCTAILSETEAHRYIIYADGSFMYNKPIPQNSLSEKYDEITREEFMAFADKAISDTYDAYELLFDTAKHIEAVKSI